MVLSALDGWLVGCVMVQETCRARGDARSSTSSQPNTYTLHQIDRPTRQITRQIYLYICAFIIFTFRIFIYRQIVRQSDRKIEREQSQILFYRNKLGQHTKVIFMPQDRLTDTTFQTNIYYIYDSIFLNRQKERLTDRKIYLD